MILSTHQYRSWPLVTEGPVTNLRDSRPDSFGNFHPLPLPDKLADTDLLLLGLDRRGDVENLIGLDTADNSLYLEGIIDSDDAYSPRHELIAQRVGPVVETAACGDFLLCRRSDASLLFLKWDADTAFYRCLGTLPGTPSFSLTAVEMGSSVFKVPAVTFSRPVTDLRADIPDHARSRIADAVNRAWTEAVESCDAANMFLQPVTVRVALRLFDGSLFSVSGPMRSPGTAWQGYDRVMLSPLFDADGNASGTAPSSFTLNPYRLRLSVDDFDHDLWNELFSALEVYVEPEKDILADGECSMSFSQQNNALSVFLSTRPKADMEGMLGSGLYAFSTASALPVAEPLLFGPPHGASLEEMPSLQSSTGTADVLLGHGAFLHIARGNRLLTTAPSNPLIQVSATDAGSRIRALAALPAGGGAYTRQYLYLCTDHGIYALTYDRDGMHTNCRPISPHRVSDPAHIVATDECVYALTDAGTLLCLRNANPQTLLRALPFFGALAWDRHADELWLMGESQRTPETSLVIQLSGAKRAFCRSVAPDYPVPQSGRVMYKSDGALFMARSYAPFFADPDTLQEAELTLRLDPPIGRLMMLQGCANAPFSISMTLKAENETLMRTCAPAELDDENRVVLATTEAAEEGNGMRSFALPFAAPAPHLFSAAPSRYTLRVTGKWRMLDYPSITSAHRPRRRSAM